MLFFMQWISLYVVTFRRLLLDIVTAAAYCLSEQSQGKSQSDSERLFLHLCTYALTQYAFHPFSPKHS